MPHVISLEERVLLFHKYINSEKIALGLTETASASPQSILITVHRYLLFFFIILIKFSDFRLSVQINAICSSPKVTYD